MAKFKMTRWSISKHNGSGKRPPYATVHLHGFHQGLFTKNTKYESYQITLHPDTKKNGNKALVQQAIKLSANGWSIPWGMDFQ